MSDNAHCHPSCPCGHSPFSKLLYRPLISLSIYLKEKFLGEIFVQKIMKCFSSYSTGEYGSLSLFCFQCNRNFFYHNTACYYFINHPSSLPQNIYSFPVNVLHKLSFCNPHSWSSFFFVVSKSSHMSPATLSCILNFLSTSACLFECVTWHL